MATIIVDDVTLNKCAFYAAAEVLKTSDEVARRVTDFDAVITIVMNVVALHNVLVCIIVGCSFLADHFDGAVAHLEHHDVSFVVVSRAPLAEIQAFKNRMGWRFNWVSSHSSDFNFDYYVSFTKEEIGTGKVFYNYEMCDFESEEMHGTSVFYKDAEGQIYHTYSCFARGDEPMIGVYNYLDLTPKGRNETGPHGNLIDWVRHHDKY